MTISVAKEGFVTVVTIARPEVRNAVDPETANELADAFRAFDEDDQASVAVLTGAGETFCAGYDLKTLAAGGAPPFSEDGPGPMGPTRMLLSKPVIAAVEGYAVAGGLELALWCDLRVASREATFGVFSRRFGVPLIDLGTVRLPRIVGLGRALDMILTGRAVAAQEAKAIGLVTLVAEPGTARDRAVELAHRIGELPQGCLRSDRRSAYEALGLSWQDALRNEFRLGIETIASGEPVRGAERFAGGEGRGGGLP